jgi:hypothetical protein
MPIGSAKELPHSEVAGQEYNTMYRVLKYTAKNFMDKKPAPTAPDGSDEHGGVLEDIPNPINASDDELEAEEISA